MKLLGKSKDELAAADVKHMHKVVGYIKRHSAQKPEGGKAKIKDSPWRYSLMNWGRDPLKKAYTNRQSLAGPTVTVGPASFSDSFIF